MCACVRAYGCTYHHHLHLMSIQIVCCVVFHLTLLGATWLAHCQCWTWIKIECESMGSCFDAGAGFCIPTLALDKPMLSLILFQPVSCCFMHFRHFPALLFHFSGFKQTQTWRMAGNRGITYALLKVTERFLLDVKSSVCMWLRDGFNAASKGRYAERYPYAFKVRDPNL